MNFYNIGNNIDLDMVRAYVESIADQVERNQDVSECHEDLIGYNNQISSGISDELSKANANEYNLMLMLNLQNIVENCLSQAKAQREAQKELKALKIEIEEPKAKNSKAKEELLRRASEIHCDIALVIMALKGEFPEGFQ